LSWRRRFEEERDRRYNELRTADQRAIEIKQHADETALGLAREAQLYRDIQANNLREQIAQERGQYVLREEWQREHQTLIDRMETALKPLAEYVAAQQGSDNAKLDVRSIILSIAGLILAAGVLVAPHIH
jgi:hypothetical protein